MRLDSSGLLELPNDKDLPEEPQRGGGNRKAGSAQALAGEAMPVSVRMLVVMVLWIVAGEAGITTSLDAAPLRQHFVTARALLLGKDEVVRQRQVHRQSIQDAGDEQVRSRKRNWAHGIPGRAARKYGRRKDTDLIGWSQARKGPGVSHESLGGLYLSRGFIMGKAITSRIECESVSSITRRSIPRPTPPVGGMPQPTALMKSSSIG